jgi:hypothetical protein
MSAARGPAVAVVLAVLLAACGPAPREVLDAVAWPDAWEVVHETEDNDTSCGEVRCPLWIRYVRTAQPPAATCDEAAAALGVAARPHAQGCTLERCIDDTFITVNVSGRQQVVEELSGPERVEAPPGGSALALRSRSGC